LYGIAKSTSILKVLKDQMVARENPRIYCYKQSHTGAE